MRTFILFLTLIALLVPLRPARAQQGAEAQEAFTAEEVVRRVLETYPTVEAAQQAIEAAEARIHQAQSRYWPRLSAEGLYRRQDPVPEITLPGGPGGAARSFAIQPNNVYDGHLSLDYTLYDFGQRDAHVDLAEAGRAIASERVEVVQSNLALQSLRSFYTVLFIEERMRVQEQQVDQLEETLEIVRRRLEAGTATRFEVLSTQTRISGAESRLIDLQSQRQSQKATLRQLLGLEPETPLALSGDFDVPTMSFEVERLVAQALEERPAVQVARAEVAQATEQVDMASSSDNPTLALNAQGGVRNGYPGELNEPRLNQSVGVSLRIPLFDGGQTDARVEEAQARTLAAQARLEDTRRAVTTEVDRAAEDLQTSIEQLETADLQVDQAREALELAQRRYRAGTITNLDLLGSVTTLAEARLQNVEVHYQILLGQYTLQKAAGTLLPFAAAR